MKRSNILISGCVAAGVGIGLMLFPPISDDLGYMLPFRDYLNGCGGSWTSIVRDSIADRAVSDNARLANIVMIVGAVFPRWIFQTVSTICIFFTLILGARIGGFETRRVVFAVWTALFMVFYPWIDQLYIVDFQLNYIWGTALSLWLLCRFVYGSRKFSLTTLLICLLLGFWHEGFAAGMFAAMAVLAVVFKKYRSVGSAAYIAALIPGILFLSLPKMGVWLNLYFATRISILLVYAIPLVVFAAFWVWGLFYTDDLKKYFSPEMVSLWILGLTGIIFMIVVPVGPRSGTLGITACLVGMCAVASTLKFRVMPVASSVATCVIYFFVFAHIAAVDVECYRSGKSTAEAVRAYIDAPGDTHFVRMTLRKDSPFICLQKPYYDWFGHQPTAEVFTRFYGSGNHPFRIAPATLEKIDPNSLTAVDGTASMSLYDGLLVGPALSDSPSTVWLDLKTSKGFREEEYYVVPLGGSGDLAWYYPNHSSLAQLFNDGIQEINLMP